MICQHQYLMSCTFQIVPPLRKCTHYGEHFLLFYAVIYLCWLELPASISHWVSMVLISTLVLLHQYDSNDKSRDICLHLYRLELIKMLQQRCLNECFL